MPLPASGLSSRKLSWLFLLSAVEGILATAGLLIIKSDVHQVLIFGYSAVRIIEGGFFLISAILFAVLSFKLRSDNRLLDFINRLSAKPIVFLIFVILGLAASIELLLLALSVGTDQELSFLRLAPVSAFMAVVSIQFLDYQWLFVKAGILHLLAPAGNLILHLSQNIFLIIASFEKSLNKTSASFLLILSFCALITIRDALIYIFPVGYGGLYALFSEQIVKNHFILPLTIPFYGPGGIPFAYPPLSFYLMAVINYLFRLAPLVYLRFAGPVLFLACSIPMFYLTKKITHSAAIACIASIFLISYPQSFVIHGEAAGMTRALALFFSLSGLYFFLRALDEFTLRITFFSGLFFGLTVLTHPTYAVFFMLSALSFSLTCGNLFKGIKVGAAVAMVGALVSSPWWLTVYFRYGANIFTAPSKSRETLGFIPLLGDPAKLLSNLAYSVSQFSRIPILPGAAIIGLVLCLFRRQFPLPVWFLIAGWISLGEELFLYPVMMITAATLIVVTAQNISVHKTPGAVAASGLFAFLIFGSIYLPGMQKIYTYAPAISEDSIKMGAWLQTNSPPTSTYLFVTPNGDEAEWLPYFTRRTPSFSSWGGEWINTYQKQLHALLDIQTCAQNQSLSCVENTVKDYQVDPDYLITRTDLPQLSASLKISDRWNLIFQNGVYFIWQKSG
jgi:hypothetical protein